MRTTVSLLALVVAGSAAAKPRAAVLPLTAQGVAQNKVSILDSLLVTELDAAGRYEVLGSNDLNAMLGFERMRDAMGCTDVACAAEIGGALGVRFLVAGTVSILGEELIVQLNLTDVKAVAVLERGRAVVPNQDTNYRRAIELAVADLFDIAPKTLAASAEPKAEPEDLPGPIFSFRTGETEFKFSVILTTADGKARTCPEPVTATSQCVLRGLALGDAHLAISAPPLSSFSDNFEIDWEGAKSAELLEIPSLTSILMWTYGGLGAAAGVTLTAVGAGTDKHGLIYGGIPAFVVGAGLLIWGFFIDGNIEVDYPGIDFFFSL